jgi:hypothetical protein
MIVVIQCAASKSAGAGHLASANGTPVVFVAQPQTAPPSDTFIYARPDDLSESGMSWRGVLLKYNETPEHNPLGLYPAHQLYENGSYGRLVKRFGVQGVYILSAGWGLIGAGFLTPYYDITYSQSAEAYKRRRKSDRYKDFRMLPEQTRDDIVFFGGKDYLPLFCQLTAAIKSRKTVIYNSGQIPSAPGCTLRRFETKTRTNWHYEAANAFVDGELQAGAAGCPFSSHFRRSPPDRARHCPAISTVHAVLDRHGLSNPMLVHKGGLRQLGGCEPRVVALIRRGSSDRLVRIHLQLYGEGDDRAAHRRELRRIPVREIRVRFVTVRASVIDGLQALIHGLAIKGGPIRDLTDRALKGVIGIL